MKEINVGDIVKHIDAHKAPEGTSYRQEVGLVASFDERDPEEEKSFVQVVWLPVEGIPRSPESRQCKTYHHKDSLEVVS